MRPSLSNLLCDSSQSSGQSEATHPTSLPVKVESTGPVIIADVKPSSSKRKREDSEQLATVTDHPSKVRRNVARRGKLYLFLDMPLDIVYEILGHLEPLDILRLARTSRDLRSFLMIRERSSIWRTARSNVGLPSPPDSMSEPAFANLVFDGYCHKCECNMRQTENILWAFSLRLCNGCRSKEFRPSWGMFQLLDVTSQQVMLHGCLPAERGIYYMESMVMDHVAEYKRLVGDAEKLDIYLAERMSLTMARQERVNVYEAWMKTREQERIQDREKLRERRQKAILRKLSELGWQEEIDNLSPRSDFHSCPLVREPKEFTDRVWIRIKDPIIELMEQIKAVRMRQVVYRNRYEVLRRMYPVYCNQQHPGIILPSLADIINLPSIKQIAELPSEAGSTSLPSDNIFEFLSTELADISRAWYDEKCAELVSIAAREVPGFKLEDLFLATTVFKCTRAKCDTRLLTFPLVLTHPCTSSYCFKRSNLKGLRGDQRWFGSSPWNQGGDRIVYDSDGSQIIRAFVETMKLDPDIVTVNDMNEFCVIVECLTCGRDVYRGHKFMFWMHALNHGRRHPNSTWSFKISTTVNVTENEAFLKAENKAIITNGSAPLARKLFGCVQCSNSSDTQAQLGTQRFSRRELITHFCTT
ncbi:hypothetical protein VKT23_019265 [Stygiomarasmius scandens]